MYIAQFIVAKFKNKKQRMRNFPKTDISYPPGTNTQVRISGVRNVSPRKILHVLFSYSHRFESPPFALLPTSCSYIVLMICSNFLTT